MLDEVTADLEWVSTMTDEQRKSELDSLDAQVIAPTASRSLHHIEVDPHRLRAHCDDLEEFDLCLRPVQSERYIALDQGRRNFAIVVRQEAGRPAIARVRRELRPRS